MTRLNDAPTSGTVTTPGEPSRETSRDGEPDRGVRPLGLNEAAPIVPLDEHGSREGEPPFQPVPASWEEVARDYGPMLYAVAYRLSGNEDDARDLVQDVLIKVNRSLGDFVPGSFTGWLYRILHNTFLDLARRRSKIRMQALPDDPARYPMGESAPDPDSALAQYRLDDDVQSALDELSPEFKAAVVMCDVVGLSYEEIAAQTGVAIGTVRSRIHRGRAELRRRLAHRLREDQHPR